MKGKVFLLALLGYIPASIAQQSIVALVDSNAMKVLFFAGLKDKLNENYNKANESFNKLIVLDPSNAAVYYEIANLNYRQNKLREAETAAKKATTLDAENLWYWKLLAELYKRKGDMDALVGVFDQMIRLSPEVDAYYFDRSNAYLLAGKTEEALKGYDILEKKFGPSATLTQARGRISLGEGVSAGKRGGASLDKLLSEDLGDVKGHLDMSGILMEKGQYDAALSILKKAKKLDADGYQINLAMADAYKGLKNPVEAMNALKLAFSDAAMPAEQKVKIVMMLLEQDKGGKGIGHAAELAGEAVKTNPNDPRVVALYGEILYQQGDLKNALHQFLESIKLSEELYRPWEQALNIQILLKQYKEAIKTADGALSVYPNQAILYYFMALALQHDHQNALALTNIKTALQFEADNGVYLELYGDVLFLNGDKAMALAQWKKAKALGNSSEKLNRKINEQKYIE